MFQRCLLTQLPKKLPPAIPRSPLPCTDSLYIGMELMDTDLRNVLKKINLSPEYTKLFLYQILRGVKVCLLMLFVCVVGS